MAIFKVTVLTVLIALGTWAQAGDLTQGKKTLTLEGAKQVLAAAISEAKRLNAPGGAIAIVDDGGHLIAAERLDNTFAAGATISIGKARTSALFRKPSGFFEDIVNKGRTAMTALPDSLFTPLRGGMPIEIDGQVVGAIGVSGAASAQQDEDIAKIAAMATTKVSAQDSRVTYFDKDQVAAAFAKGMPLLEVPEYKIHASRRTKSGLAEVHEHETDVVYVLEGSATFVTGGKLVDANTVSPGEIRGTDVQGGETRRLVKGDVVVVPPNTHHWFKEVSDPFLYFVVKPISE
jgi:uncharacterized protein GlcG (DUF336 family)/quercetin dioxygenase-like cupin family protein